MAESNKANNSNEIQKSKVQEDESIDAKVTPADILANSGGLGLLDSFAVNPGTLMKYLIWILCIFLIAIIFFTFKIPPEHTSMMVGLIILIVLFLIVLIIFKDIVTSTAPNDQKNEKTD